MKLKLRLPWPSKPYKTGRRFSGRGFRGHVARFVGYDQSDYGYMRQGVFLEVGGGLVKAELIGPFGAGKRKREYLEVEVKP